jgi:NAD(P)-dependent dehydrogenase (short-subunit alcohol dehydrogenase family)
MRFADRVVLITGGSRGIGLATARQFADEGARTVLSGRNPARGAEACRAVPGGAFVAGDVRRAADCERMVGETLRMHGRLDVLVHAAGIIYRDRPVEAMSEAEWDATFDTNVKGAFLVSRSALPALRARKGNIVNVASYVGLVGFAGAAAYAASKAALVNLTRSMALDHAAEGIRVNCVCPGSVATDMIFDAWKAFPDPEAARRRWEGKHPLGRIATPEEVARAILFLASPDASFVTGAALPVDGGITAG